MNASMTPPSVKKIFAEDLLIRDALLKRNGKATRLFLYQQCYPLFKSIYDNYYTDCTCVKEFIDEIYILTLSPSKKTGKCQLQNFRGESTLATWYKTACLYYCYSKYEIRGRMPVKEQLPPPAGEKNDALGDRTDEIFGSNEIDFDNLNREDAMKIINMMSNERYRNIIRMIYLEQKTVEEAADALEMTKSNFYNKHLLAKEQFLKVLRKEEQYG